MVKKSVLLIPFDVACGGKEMGKPIQKQQNRHKGFHNNEMRQTGTDIQPRTHVGYEIQKLQNHKIGKYQNNTKHLQDIFFSYGIDRSKDAAGKQKRHDDFQ